MEKESTEQSAPVSPADIPLTSPPGYGPIVPLDRDRHAGFGVREAASHRMAAGLHAIYLTAMEFFPAARHYPIAFIHDEPNETYHPFVITGLALGENLFVDDHGHWDAGAYVPAYVRRYPFCSLDIRKADGEESILVCVDEAGLDKGDGIEPLFGDDRSPGEAWTRMEAFINEMERARRVTDSFMKFVTNLELLESFEAHAHPVGGDRVRLQGLFRVSEERLNKLSGKVVKDLMTRGELSRIYAHLMSLDNFAGLLDRKAARS